MAEVTIEEKLHPIKSLDKETSLKAISDIIWSEHPDAIIVVEKIPQTGKQRIIGIVTESDIIMRVEKDNLYSETIKVKDIMSSPVISIEASKGIQEAIDLMAGKKIQKLLVTKDGNPLGILYGDEVLELDREKWKELLFNRTVEAVYKLLLKEWSTDITIVFSNIRKTITFTNLDSEIQLDLFVYQQGIVLVTYNFLKENRSMPLPEIKAEIKSNYSDLLAKYTQQED